MVRTDLTAQALDSTGVVATYDAANVDGHMFKNNGKRFLHVKNDSTTVALNVTVQTTLTADDDLALPNRVVPLAVSTEAFIGLFDQNVYNQKSGADAGKVYVDYDATTSVSVALLETE